MRHAVSFLTAHTFAGMFTGVLLAGAGAGAAEQVDFRRDIRPILANHCWSCHGPDEAARKAGLRLDLRGAAVAKARSGDLPIVPHEPDASELIARIESPEAEVIMPPPAAKRPLTPQQRELLRRWVAQGADYAQHWAFVPPHRPAVPDVKHKGWPTNPIDFFVLKRLEEAGLSPSPEAGRRTWLRRVTLDLTGLPPSPQDLDSFLGDNAPGAYERVVDRLLTSPRHAERMAMHWLDAARYADTNGYNNDEGRSMWPWRDWVIDAFARGLPYDRFLTEQLAGDLLPNPTLAQQVATGFNRNHVLTTEGGVFEEEYHIEYVADRVHTTATVFLGLSMQCARCHDHKYDPVSQREYYQFSAFFNNVPDKIVGYSQGKMAAPLLKVPSPQQQADVDLLQRRRGELDALLKQRVAGIDADLLLWEQRLTPEEIAKTGPVGLVAHFPLDEPDGEQVIDATDSARRGTIRGKVSRGPGKVGKSLELDGNTFVEAGESGSFESDQKFSISVWIQPTSNEATTVLSKMDDANAFRGYDLIMEGGKVAAHFVHHWPDSAFKVVSKEPVPLNAWHHLAVSYDGSRKAGGVKMYVDGKPQALDVTTNNVLSGTLKTDKPFHIGKRQTSLPFKGRIDDVQLYATELSAADAAQLASGQPLGQLREILALARAQRSEPQQALVRQFYLDRVDAEARRLKSELADLPRRLEEIDKAIPVTMVMQEQTPRRPAFILRRGQYDQRGDEVAANVPAVLTGLPQDAPLNRLGLARWLTSPAHPLTARVAVNRWWEMLFGAGLVETTEDFGVQGALPSHPELLDWLATELIRTGWDQRVLLREIVLSATYRQASRTTPALHERDPRNRLLARGPRARLPAETVRDNALAVSGLLSERIGGPSVKPYQPEGLWEDVSVERREKYVPDAGGGLYRRSMYTFWKRTCPPPGMSTFDAPDRETCVIRRARTNTPLQALVLLNDPTYVEAARKLAERSRSYAQSDDERLAFAFQLVLCRAPENAERDVLLEVYRDALNGFRIAPAEAEKLLSVGRSPRDTATNPAELAAWTAVMNMLLNLDEAISKT